MMNYARIIYVYIRISERREVNLLMELREINRAPLLKRTPLHSVHVELGARMMPFAGYVMPVQYTGIVAEHLAVRLKVGLFDVSHMGEFIVEGPHAAEFLQYLLTNDVSRLVDGKAMYTLMCNDNGGIVDDLLVYRLHASKYMLVVNAANIQKDLAWMQSKNSHNAVIRDVSDQTALLAVQGPGAFDLVQRLTDIPISDLGYYRFTEADAQAFLGLDGVLLSRTGYTGEPGLEIYCRSEDVVTLWHELMEDMETTGLLPAGLGARDTLRLEAGFCLYGNDITDDTNPLEAGLGWVTKFDKGDFVGRASLLAVKEQSPARTLIGFILEERGIPRQGYPILNAEGEAIGTVTSGSQSPMLDKGIGLGYVVNDPAYTTPGRQITISIRSKNHTALIAKPPFHKS